MGVVLLQKKEDGKKHPIAYYLKTLSAAERNYDVYNLELLAIVNALDHWRPYLAGSPHKIIIYSDHQNLLYLLRFSHLTVLTLQTIIGTVIFTSSSPPITHRL
jgi:hypothetical protein